MEKNRIKQLNIKNFRGIENIKIENCKNINIILGKNNTCKTSILEAIEFIEEPNNFYKQGELIARNPLFKTRLLENYLHAFRMKNIDIPIEIAIDNGDKHSLKIYGEREIGYRESKEKKYIRQLKERYFSDRENHFLDKKDISLLKMRIRSILQESNIGEEEYRELLKNLKIGNSLENVLEIVGQYIKEEEKFEKYKFIYDYNNEVKELEVEEDSFYNRPIYNRTIKNKKIMNIVYSNPLDYLLIDDSIREIDKIITEGYKEDVIKLLKMFEPKIKDFNILSNRDIICNLEEGYLNIQSFGDGFKKVLILFAKLVLAKNGILLIDEIETGIHHSKINEIYTALSKIASENNTQIFMTTHNLETVSTFLDIMKDKLEEVQVYRVENYKDKKIVRDISGSQAYEIIINSGGDLR